MRRHSPAPLLCLAAGALLWTGGPGPEGKGQAGRPLTARRLLPRRARAGRRTPCVRDQDVGGRPSLGWSVGCGPGARQGGRLCTRRPPCPHHRPRTDTPPGVVGECHESQSHLCRRRMPLAPTVSRQAMTRMCLRAPPNLHCTLGTGASGRPRPSAPYSGGRSGVEGPFPPLRALELSPVLRLGRDPRRHLPRVSPVPPVGRWAPRTDPQPPGRGPPHPSALH